MFIRLSIYVSIYLSIQVYTYMFISVYASGGRVLQLLLEEQILHVEQNKQRKNAADYYLHVQQNKIKMPTNSSCRIKQNKAANKIFKLSKTKQNCRHILRVKQDNSNRKLTTH